MKTKSVKTLLRRALTTACVAAMGVTLFAGCGSSSKTDSTSTSSGTEAAASEETVALSMYVVSNRPAGQDTIDEKLNEYLKEKLNCTLQINWIDWASYANKYPLLFSSGEEFDMAYCATWLNFSTLATKGAFKSLDELWEANAPKNYAMQSKEALEQATVDGHLYCVPTLLATYNAYGPIYRTIFEEADGTTVDLVADGYWDGTMETFEDLEEYMDAVKANTSMMEILDISQSGPEIFFTWAQNQGLTYVYKGMNYMFIDPTEENPTIQCGYDVANIDQFLEMMNRWNEKGFFTKSALSDTDTTKTQNGKAAVKVHNIDNYASYSVLQPTWGFKFSNLVSTLAHLPYTQDCLVISNTSKHPEKALQLWDAITTDQEVFDIFYYGVLGTSYEVNDKGQFTILDSDLYSTSSCWAARTTELYRQQAGTPDDYYTIEKDWEENVIKSGEGAERFTGFVFDTTPVETEVAACTTVYQQYWWPLELGYTDPVKGLEEYKTQMQAAGIEKVVAEAQKQLDAYVESHKSTN